jgi:hypothetical protein
MQNHLSIQCPVSGIRVGLDSHGKLLTDYAKPFLTSVTSVQGRLSCQRHLANAITSGCITELWAYWAGRAASCLQANLAAETIDTYNMCMSMAETGLRCFRVYQEFSFFHGLLYKAHSCRQ